MAFRDDLIQVVTEYCDSDEELAGSKPSPLLVDFVLEQFKQHRNYPDTFSLDKVESDMEKYKSTIAMAVVDVFVKTGAEGQTSHSENGVVRQYDSAYISKSLFKNVLPYVKVLR